MKATSNGVFQGDDPLDYALPLAILQICMVVVLTRGLAFLLRPLRQPRVIAETIGGILLGPSVFGRSQAYLHKVFPPKSYTAFGHHSQSRPALSLSRILAELKLLTTDVGRMAMSAAAVNDVAAWILLALAIALSGSGSPLISLWVFLCGCAFVLACAFFVPPICKWMAQRCPEGEPVNEMYVCATLTAVLAAGFVTDTIGIHALFGAFIIGVVVPKDRPFAGALVEKVEDLVSGLFLPLYFISSGLKTNVATIQWPQSWGLIVLVICTACFGKIIGTVAGMVELIVLNIGKDRGVLNDQTFAIMVLMALFTTFITTPLVIAVTSNIPTLINLIKASRGKKRGLCVYAMHLVELSERSSAILMVHKARRNGLPFWNKGLKSGTNQINVAFEAFRQLSHVYIRPMTAISPMNSMHEDICSSAERKSAAIIIVPFHKHQRLDGQLETTRSDFRYVNKRVLKHAPCSVGILVDRGLGGTTHVSASNVDSVIKVLFFGGPDDREALAYAGRMAEHPGINLVMVRFLLNPKVVGEAVVLDIDSGPEARSADEEFLAEFKEKISKDSSIKYEERIVSRAGETVGAIREHSRCNLFLVGRMPEGQLVAALKGNSECPELGPVGGLLTSPEFSTNASVLVVQQYHSQLSLHSLASLKDDDDEELPRDSDTN
ncbi:cation/H+ exchanger 18 [Actinidia rufa]|uniref:Cation/H+ exchanger 18 n=1 Tax=Actinidia rufa TaxID=165716 RepID=A0A7J0FSA4_9ERIC|nr:cation/H+ exchanger 18 [Actinidia rufa]